MQITKLFGVDGAKQAHGVTVVIDILRAATVAAYLLDKGVKEILPVASKEEAFAYKERHPDCILVGEEHGYRIPGFEFGNSPYEISQSPALTGKTAVHRSSMGTQGIVNASGASEIIFGSFTTGSAVAQYLKNKRPEHLSVIAMDGEGSEDDLFANFLIATLQDEPTQPLEEIVQYMRSHPGGARFLDPDNHEFPEQDFHLCLELDRFDFVPLLRGSGIVKHEESVLESVHVE